MTAKRKQTTTSNNRSHTQAVSVKGLYQKRGWYYYQPPTQSSGQARPCAMALKTKNLVEAIQAIQEIRTELALERAVIHNTVAEVLPQYLNSKRKDAASTKRARISILNRFIEDTGNPKLNELNHDLIENWRESLAGNDGHKRHRIAPQKTGEAVGAGGGARRGLSGASVRSYTITLRAFMNWMREEGMINHDPAAKLKRHLIAVRTRRQDFITVPQREALLAADAPDYLRLVLHLGFFAGLRDGEMLAMTRRWVWVADDASRGSLTVQETPMTMRNGHPWVWRPKTREIRTIPLHPRLLEFLKHYGLPEPFVLAPHKPEWPDERLNCKRFECRKVLQSVAEAAGVPHLTFHMMRHSFATHLAMNGTPLAVIAGLLGDSLSVTEDHYAGYCPSGNAALMAL